METAEILLVEDNAGDAVLIRQILADASVPVKLHIVRDGEQALTILSDSDFRPDLIILDLNIPRISGAALLERWKSIQTPVVVFSSTLNENERERALALGAREFIRKPTDVTVFSEVVCGIVERYAGPGGSKTAGGASA
jgi:two-component system, chemotaxis family, response regulator Rcp1